MAPEVERRLAAIMFTDIVGYTALMAESEEKGLRARARHRGLVRPLVEKYHGESIGARGDESLSTFPTALDAVNCALAIEEQTHSNPGYEPDGDRFQASPHRVPGELDERLVRVLRTCCGYRRLSVSIGGRKSATSRDHSS